jgi:hypothetical protein
MAASSSPIARWPDRVTNISPSGHQSGIEAPDGCLHSGDMHTVTAVLLLTARFYSLPDVPATDRRAAAEVAANILHEAGIDLRWSDCNDRHAPRGRATVPACPTPPGPDEVIVRFVTAGSPNVSGTPVGESLGDAFVDTAAASGSLATVYVDRVAMMSRASGVDAGTLLGRVAAHEIGHLLLGTTSHGSTGLMRAAWSTTMLQRRIANDWRFSRLDAAAAREGALRRASTVQARAGDQTPVIVPCVESTALAPAMCPSCPVCATLVPADLVSFLPADRVSFHLLVEPGF